MSPLFLICRRQLCYLACLLCLLPVVAAAQSPPVLRLEQAVTLALAHNQGLQIAADQMRDGEISVRLQQDQYLPQITASGTASLHHDVGAQEEECNYSNLASDIKLSLNLFSGFSVQAALEKARQTLAARQHSFGRAQQQVVFTVIGNYLNAVKALEQIRVAEQNLLDNAQQLSDIEAYHQAGRRPVTDVYKQQAETASARSTLFGAQRDYRVNKLALLQSIGIDATTKIDVVLPNSPLLHNIPETSETVLLATALNGRPDLLALQKNVAASVEQIRLAQAGHYPSVDLVAVAATSFNDREEDDFASQLKEDNLTGTLSLSLSIPIFDRNLTRHEVDQARVGRNTAGLELAKLQRQIEAEIGQAVADFETAGQQLEAAREQLNYADKALESTTQRYRAGVATLTEITSARSVLVEARYAQIEAQLDRMIQTVAIAHYSGDLNPILFSKEISG